MGSETRSQTPHHYYGGPWDGRTDYFGEVHDTIHASLFSDPWEEAHYARMDMMTYFANPPRFGIYRRTPGTYDLVWQGEASR